VVIDIYLEPKDKRRSRGRGRLVIQRFIKAAGRRKKPNNKKKDFYVE